MSIAVTLPATGGRVWFARFFLWLVLVQGFHFVEHCVQLVQRYVFDDANGNGLLGNLAGFEQLHFGYNTLFLFGLLWLYTEVSLAARPAWSRHRLVAGLLAAALAVQGYHEVEHVLRMGQVLGWLPVNPAAIATTGEPPGLLGQWFNGALIHWALNGIVEALPVGAFVLGGFQVLLNPIRSARVC
jgi:hypothetical protein